MKILLIGATGAAGRAIRAEAEARGHQVSAASRSSADHQLDADDSAAVATAARGHQVIISATRPAPGDEAAVVVTTTGLAVGAAESGVRLLVVGGSAPLLVPGTNRRALDDPTWVPASIRAIAQASLDQLLALQRHPHTDWLYLAPPAIFEPGERTGHYRRGADELLLAADGSSRLSMADFAIGVLDEAEQPRAHQQVLALGPVG